VAVVSNDIVYIRQKVYEMRETKLSSLITPYIVNTLTIPLHSVGFVGD